MVRKKTGGPDWAVQDQAWQVLNGPVHWTYDLVPFYDGHHGPTVMDSPESLNGKCSVGR